MGKRQSLQQMMLRKLDSYMQKNETGSLSYNTHKSKMKLLGIHENKKLSLCIAKETIHKMKRQFIEWEKKLEHYIQ